MTTNVKLQRSDLFLRNLGGLSAINCGSLKCGKVQVSIQKPPIRLLPIGGGRGVWWRSKIWEYGHHRNVFCFRRLVISGVLRVNLPKYK